MKTRITEELSDTKYFVHCRSQYLNLVIDNNCVNVPVIRNVMAILRKTTRFINGSSKRKNIMKSKFNYTS